MFDKICVVTGANSGIGRATVEGLAAKGVRVVMVCRNREKGAESLREIVKSTGNQRIELMICDLSLLNDVKRLADEINEKYPAIDVLVNNAGIITDKRTITADGFETTFATNYLGHFLLTNLLLDNLRASPSGRIVTVASEAERMGSLYFNDLQLENDFSAMKAYCQSKLANIVFTYDLARRLKGSNVTANCMHPGVVSSNFGKNLTGMLKIPFTFSGIFLRKPEKGAETVIWLSIAPEIEGVTGRYFHDLKEIKSQAISYIPTVQQKLWEISEEMTGLKSMISSKRRSDAVS